MLHRATDVVVYVRLTFSVSDAVTALLACWPLIEELGARRVAARPTKYAAEDTYTVRMKLIEPIRDGEDGAHALHRVTLPLWVRLGFAESAFAVAASGREIEGGSLGLTDVPDNSLPDCDTVRFHAWDR
jgi:hypothetical protein